MGNPSPVLVARDVVVASPPRMIGKDGLKVSVRGNDRYLVAIGWGMAPRIGELEPGRSIDIAFRIERDDWNGESRLQARLADFRA
jgi:single-stranded-DNA-specific exonuclease